MPRHKPQNVVILPARAGADTAPPAAPWWLGMRRFLTGLIAIAPFVIDAAISLANQGQLKIPPQYTALWAVGVLAWQGYTKTQREHVRAEDAAHLEDQGLPVGKPLDAQSVKHALTSDYRLPAYVAPPPRPTGPDPGRSTWP
jgi:hypothetical protein